MRNGREATKREAAEFLSGHAACGGVRERPTDGFGDEWHRARGAGVHFNHPYFAVLNGELYVHEAADVQSLRELARDGVDFGNSALREGNRRRDGGGIAGVAASGFNVLENRAHDRRLAVADAVDVKFNRVSEELVDEDGV